MCKVDIRPMLKLVEDYASPTELGALMDEVMFDFACSKIERRESGGELDIVNKLATLRELRDVFNSM